MFFFSDFFNLDLDSYNPNHRKLDMPESDSEDDEEEEEQEQAEIIKLSDKFEQNLNKI